MSEMLVRDWSPDDYDLVRPWWERWGTPPKRETMGDMGLVAEQRGCPAAAIFLFPAEAGYCLITGGISDFDLPREVREEAICRVTMAALDRARDLGMRNIRLYIATRGYIRGLEARGFRPQGPRRSSVFVSPVYLPFLGEDDE